MILNWYHPKNPRSKVETFLPYKEFWRYRKDGSKPDEPDDCFTTLTEKQQMKFDLSKVTTDAKLTQEMREVAQHGRSVTIAVDVRMYAIMSGEVRTAWNGRLSTQGWIKSILAYGILRGHVDVRRLEIKPEPNKGRPQRRGELKRYFEKAQAIKDTGEAPGNRHLGGRDWKIVPQRDPGRSCWCAYCNRPIAPYGQVMYGRPGQGARHADFFQAIHNKLLSVDVKFGDVSARITHEGRFEILVRHLGCHGHEPCRAPLHSNEDWVPGGRVRGKEDTYGISR